jgi:hypothetical protein
VGDPYPPVQRHLRAIAIRLFFHSSRGVDR